MCIAPIHDAHDATAKTLDEHFAIAQLDFIHHDAVICDFLFNPALKA